MTASETEETAPAPEPKIEDAPLSLFSQSIVVTDSQIQGKAKYCLGNRQATYVLTLAIGLADYRKLKFLEVIEAHCVIASIPDGEVIKSDDYSNLLLTELQQEIIPTGLRWLARDIGSLTSERLRQLKGEQS